MTANPWHLSWRADPAARAVADRHYNRQSIGSDQFVPPGRCVVLRTPEAGAGFRLAGTTKGGLLAFIIDPCDMPSANPAIGTQTALLTAESV